jgi:hypothetical protein
MTSFPPPLQQPSPFNCPAWIRHRRTMWEGGAFGIAKHSIWPYQTNRALEGILSTKQSAKPARILISQGEFNGALLGTQIRDKRLNLRSFLKTPIVFFYCQIHRQLTERIQAAFAECASKPWTMLGADIICNHIKASRSEALTPRPRLNARNSCSSRR